LPFAENLWIIVEENHIASNEALRPKAKYLNAKAAVKFQ